MIDSILKESGMTIKEFDEVKRIAMEMKSNVQFELLNPTLITMARTTKEVTVAQTSVYAPIVPYVVVALQQPPKNLVKTEEVLAPRKSTRLEKTTPPKKRVKKTTSGSSKKTRTL